LAYKLTTLSNPQSWEKQLIQIGAGAS